MRRFVERLAGMWGAAVEHVPAETGCQGARWRLEGLGARGKRRWSRLPLEGLYVRNGFGLGGLRFAVVQVKQAIFPVAHSQLVHI